MIKWLLARFVHLMFRFQCVKVEASFMSEQAILYLGLVGLLGEYCPTSRKKNPHICKIFGRMYLLSFLEHLELCGCIRVSTDQSSHARISLEDTFSLKPNTQYL